MTPDRWELITKIYHSALELEPVEREVFLHEKCADDESMRREIDSLFAAGEKADGFISEHAINKVAPLLDEDPPLKKGQKLVHYEIISRLGSGGMGEVYLAKDEKLHRLVALKTLPQTFSQVPQYLKRFQTEAKAAATLNHPNIATVFSVEEESDRPFIVMEYVEGKTLNKLIGTSGLDLKIFLEWFIKIADALAHAHQKGIIHRDIKPGNIMITTDETPKILDFGLAQIRKETFDEDNSTFRTTPPQLIFGTPSYMSPEQAEGKPIDARTDIFSLGIVMYEAITGVRPFQGESYPAIISNLLKTEPISVSDIKSDVPFLLARLISRCLNKQPRHRFQTMNEVRVILEEIQAAVEAEISMNSSSNPRSSKHYPLFARKWIVALMVFLVPVVGFLIFYLASGDYAASKIDFDEMTIRKLSQSNDVEYASITPDGNSIVYYRIENDQRSLWIRRINDKNALQLLPPQSVHFWGGLTISADGSQIFYITARKYGKYGTLFRISSFGGAPRILVDKVNDLGGLSPDGQRILYIRYNEPAQMLSANSSDGSDEQIIHTGKSNQLLRDPQFSTDGQKIFFVKYEKVLGHESWALVEIPSRGGPERNIIPPQKRQISELRALDDGRGLLVNFNDDSSNTQQIYFINIANGEKKRITNNLNSYFGISVSDDEKMVVAAQRTFAKDIWIALDKDFQKFRKITTEPNVYSQAVLSPDGKIVYDATDNNQPHIWIMNSDGSNPQQLSPNDTSDYHPIVTPDGRYIVFTSERTGERKLWRMNIDGSNPQILAQVNGTTSEAVLSPDGKYVFFKWNRENKNVLGKISINGGDIAEQPLYTERFTWVISPDGRLVAYPFYDENEKNYKVKIHPLDSEQPTTTLDILPYNILVWKKDSKALFYRSLEADKDSIWTIWEQSLRGGQPQPYIQVEEDVIFSLSQTDDEKYTVIVRGKLLTDAVMLTQTK